MGRPGEQRAEVEEKSKCSGSDLTCAVGAERAWDGEGGLGPYTTFILVPGELKLCIGIAWPGVSRTLLSYN